jgi:hypothetical protein
MDQRIRASMRYKRVYVVKLARADENGSVELLVNVSRDTEGRWRTSPLAVLYSLWFQRDVTPHDRLVRMQGILKEANLQSVAITGGFTIRQERIQAYLNGEVSGNEVFDYSAK